MTRKTATRAGAAFFAVGSTCFSWLLLAQKSFATAPPALS